MMKKYLAAALALCLCLALISACNGSGAPDPTATPDPTPIADTLSGATNEILDELIAGSNKYLSADEPLPASFTDPITAETAEGALGLTAAQFGEYVTDAYAANAMIMSFAHEIALVKCVDAAAALQVKDLIAGGFNSGKWICVFPEQSFTVECGSYVLLVASSAANGTAVTRSLSDLARSNIGLVNIFYTRPADVPTDGGGGLTLS
jgi:hypothetical protein